MDSSDPVLPLEDRAAVDPRSVLVAIPTLNEDEHIGATLKALIGDGSLQFKVVVADGGSTDKTREIVNDMAGRHSNIHLIDNPDRIQSAAINRVVEHAADPHHSILVRADAHSDYPVG